jgi:hypothetical protein
VERPGPILERLLDAPNRTRYVKDGINDYSGDRAGCCRKGVGGTGDWQLFTLREDPAELHDLSEVYREARDDVQAQRTTNGVITSAAGPYAKREP